LRNEQIATHVAESNHPRRIQCDPRPVMAGLFETSHDCHCCTYTALRRWVLRQFPTVG